jgi:hypothetical protein
MSGSFRSLVAIFSLAACEPAATPGPDGGNPPMWTRFVDTPRSAALWGMPMVAVPAERRFVGFGGSPAKDQPPLSDTWSLSMRDQSWTRVLDLTQPPARAHHCSAYLPDQNQLMVVGGADQNGPMAPAAYAINLATRTWSEVTGPLPAGTLGCMAAWLSAQGRMIVFGGAGQSGPLSDTWSFDPHAGMFEQLHPTTSPPARSDGVLVDDGTRLLLYGGLADRDLGDVWSFDGTTWTQLDSGPPARHGALSAFDSTGKRWMVFGGQSDSTMLDEVWQFSTAWSKFDVAAGPPARAFAGGGWDAGNDVLVVLGGLGQDGALADGWMLNLR